MWLPLTCMECSMTHLVGGDDRERRETTWIPCELTDDGVYQATCPAGHQIRAVLQDLKHEILFECGAVAMLVGFHREAVTSFHVALERFLEFAMRVLLRVHGVPDAAVDTAWNQVAKQSERQLGALLFLYLLDFKTPFPTIDDGSGLRNKVIHSGYLPNRDESFRYGRHVFDLIETTQLQLEQKHRHVFDAVARAPLFEGHRRLHAAGDAIQPSGDKWRGPSSMALMTALSHNVERTAPRDFEAAMAGIRERLPWYGHSAD